MKKICICIAVCLIAFLGCTTSDITTKKTKSLYPAWYNSSADFSSDSLYYSGFATAIAKDSAGAVSKAIEQATAQLDMGLDKKMEDLRQDIVDEEGSGSFAATTNLIRGIRNYQISQNILEDPEIEVSTNENQTRAFVRIRGERIKIQSDIMDHIEHATIYETKFKGSVIYTSL